MEVIVTSYEDWRGCDATASTSPTPPRQTIMPTVTSFLSIRIAVSLKSFGFWLKTTNLFLFDGLSTLQTAPLHLIISVGWEIFWGVMIHEDVNKYQNKTKRMVPMRIELMISC